MLESEFALVAQAYKCTKATQVRSYPVHHAGLRKLYTQFGRLLQQLGNTDDLYWLSLLRHLRRVRFDLSALPVPFNAPEHGLATAQTVAEATYARCAVLYPSLAPVVDTVLGMARALLSSGDAPLLARLVEAVEETTPANTAIILCEARLIKVAEAFLHTHPALWRCAVIGPAQLRAVRCYDRLIFVGSARWFPSYVVTAPRSSCVDFIHLSWTEGPKPAQPLFAVQRAKTAMRDSSGFSAPAEDNPPSVVLSGERSSSIEEESVWVDSGAVLAPGQSFLQELVHRANSANASSERRLDIVRALPIALEGGRAVFLEAEDGATVLVLDLAERGKSRVRRLPTQDVEAGMFVLLRAAGGGDYVVPVADMVLGRRAEECRRVQGDWKARLRAYVEHHGLFEASVMLLEHGGVRAEEGNVRRWTLDRNIRPRDNADFLAIMRLIGLEADASRYWGIMTLIERAHIKAGQLIRSMLLDQVMKADLAALERIGTMEFDLPGTGSGRMVACRVLRIASEPVMVSAAQVSQLFASENPPWR